MVRTQVQELQAAHSIVEVVEEHNMVASAASVERIEQQGRVEQEQDCHNKEEGDIVVAVYMPSNYIQYSQKYMRQN